MNRVIVDQFNRLEYALFVAGSFLVVSVWLVVCVRTTACLRATTRNTVAHSLFMVWAVKICALIICVGSAFSLTSTLRWHWVLGSVLAGLVIFFALLDKVRVITPPVPPQSREAYSRAWQEYRRLRKITWLAGIAFLLAVVMALMSIVELLPRVPSGIFDSLFVTLAALAVVLFFVNIQNEWKLRYWACPRCGHRFRSLWVGSVMPKSCNHCRLARWAEAP